MAYALARMQPPAKALTAAAAARREELFGFLFRKLRGRVQRGPFEGTRLLEGYSWGDGDLGAKLLGCYEQELWPHLEAAFERGPTHILNVGCAEGYYAVGLARRLPRAQVYAVDPEPAAREACERLVAHNRVSGRVEVAFGCDVPFFNLLLSVREPTLVVMDCEGYEKALIDPARVPGLRAADLIIECHDFADPTITPTLRRRLAATHRLTEVVEGPRDPNAYRQLTGMSSLDRWLVVSENRPCTMRWLVATARRRASARSSPRSSRAA